MRLIKIRKSVTQFYLLVEKIKFSSSFSSCLWSLGVQQVAITESLKDISPKTLQSNIS